MCSQERILNWRNEKKLETLTDNDKLLEVGLKEDLVLRPWKHMAANLLFTNQVDSYIAVQYPQLYVFMVLKNKYVRHLLWVKSVWS